MRFTWSDLVAVPGFLLSGMFVLLSKYNSSVYHYFIAVFVAIALNISLVYFSKIHYRRCCVTTLLKHLHDFLISLPPSQIGRISSISDDDDFRYTIFIPSRFIDRLFQLARYYQGKIDISHTTLNYGEGVGGQAFQRNEDVIIPDVSANTSDAKGSWVKTLVHWGMSEKKIRKLGVLDRGGYACLPIKTGSAKIGVLCVDTETRDAISPEIVDKIRGYLSSIKDVTEKGGLFNGR